ncbi:hypothetical protein CANARDRAFT_27087 [[Candida] arabinofermentans NRRL YB-2248]|uniref:Copper transport protein n=1 Tax=[Candida] arabinofermentans NRRL YB-2248 TaxID=983967 RepID=A0A1E4T4G6_9ASCO|nr:hypothetical protein CANARDRAFT_27087 [[Candida] arabinofermentans NRRL YB-2248]
MAMDMDMGTTTTSSSMMDMATSTAMSSSSTSTSSSMDMSDMSDMSMNYYLTKNYDNYPVLFKQLTASSAAGAFGIFVFIFFLAFALRGLFFLSAYLEQKVFHNYTNSVLIQEIDNCACGPSESDEKEGGSKSSSTFGNSNVAIVLKKTMFPGLSELGKDAVRLVIAFVAAMFGYALMLATMSFVLPYFFAACLGIAFGEVFFNRLSIVLEINKNSSMCGSLH